MSKETHFSSEHSRLFYLVIFLLIAADLYSFAEVIKQGNEGLSATRLAGQVEAVFDEVSDLSFEDPTSAVQARKLLNEFDSSLKDGSAPYYNQEFFAYLISILDSFGPNFISTQDFTLSDFQSSARDIRDHAKSEQYKETSEALFYLVLFILANAGAIATFETTKVTRKRKNEEVIAKRKRRPTIEEYIYKDSGEPTISFQELMDSPEEINSENQDTPQSRSSRG